jgi:hypothetical protein
MQANFNPAAVNAQALRDLQNGRLAGNLADKAGATTTAAGANKGTAPKKALNTPKPTAKPAVDNDTGEGIQLSPQAKSEAAKQQQQAENGELADLAHKAGCDLSDGGTKTSDEEDKANEVAREKNNKQADGSQLFVTSSGEQFKVAATDTERLNKLTATDDHHLDEMENRVLGDIPDENLKAAEGVLTMQTAKGVSAAATLKQLDPAQETERNRPELAIQGTAENVGIREPGNDKSSAPLKLELPEGTEAAAAEFTAKQANTPSTDPIVAQALAEKEAKIQSAQQPLTIEQAKTIQKDTSTLLQESYKGVMRGAVAANGVELIAQGMKQQAQQQGSQLSDSQARVQASQYLADPQVQGQVSQGIEQAMQQQFSEHGKYVDAEAKLKNIQLSKEEKQSLTMISVGKDWLSKASDAPQLSVVLGKDSGVPDYRDLVLQHTDSKGQVNAGALAQDLGKNFQKALPLAEKRTQELTVKIRDCKDPNERTKLLDEMVGIQSLLGAYEATHSTATMIDAATQQLRAAETIKTGGKSSDPACLTQMSNGKVVIPGAIGVANSVASKESDALYELMDSKLKDQKVSKEDAAKIDAETQAKALKLAGGNQEDQQMGEYLYLCQAGEVAGWAASQLAKVDKTSAAGQNFASINASALAYIDSRANFIEANAPGSLKSNPEFQSMRSQWMAAKQGLSGQ